MRGLLYGISHTRLHAPSLQNDTEMLVKHPSHTDWKKLSHDTQPHQEELTQTSPFFQMAHLREHTHRHTHTPLIDFTAGSGGGQQSSGEVLDYCCFFLESF